MMKSKNVVILGVVMAMSTVLMAQELDFSVTADYFNKYLWRGQNYMNDGVIQPSVGVAYGNLSANIWGNYLLKDDATGHNSDQFNEINYTVDYTDSVPGVDILSYSGGIIVYDFPNTTAPATTEIYAGLAVDTLLNPSVTLYQDVDQTDGLYISVGIGHGVAIPDFGLGELSLDLGASLGWGSRNYNQYYWNSTTPGADPKVFGDSLQDLVISAALPIELCDYATVTPSISYVGLVDSTLRRQDTYSARSDHIVGGVGLVIEF